MSEDNKSIAVACFVAGAALGAAVAFLYAPAAGTETRKNLSLNTEKGRRALADSGREMFDRGREIFEQGRKLAEEAADVFERGRLLAEGIESTAGENQSN